jgi:hypothetical protein
MAWQHACPVFRVSQVGWRGNTFVRSDESRRCRVGSFGRHTRRRIRVSRGATGQAFPVRARCRSRRRVRLAETAMHRVTGGPFLVDGSQATSGAPSEPASGVSVDSTKYEWVSNGRPGWRRVIMAVRRSGGSSGRERGGRVGPSGPSMEHGVRVATRRIRSADNVRRGRMAERSCRPRGRNEPLKGEAHGRYRCETKPEGLREE